MCHARLFLRITMGDAHLVPRAEPWLYRIYSKTLEAHRDREQPPMSTFHYFYVLYLFPNLTYNTTRRCVGQ